MQVLYICKRNDARSLMSEAITNQMAGGRITAKSAGITPNRKTDINAIAQLIKNGFYVDNLYSKSLSDIADYEPNIVISLCDDSATLCDSVFNNVMHLKWGIPDLAQYAEDEDRGEFAHKKVVALIQERVEMMLNLPIETIADDRVKQELSIAAGASGSVIK